MLRRTLSRIAARLRRDDGDGDDSRFVPSRLDASVRYAHGGSDAEVDRELARIDDVARRLDEGRDE